MKNLGLLFAGVLAAVAASSCCILPLLLGAASAGTVGLGAALTPYRPYLMSLTVLLLGAAFYVAYRPETTGCDADGSCSPGKATGTKRTSRALLWGVTLFTVGAMAYPHIAARRVAISTMPVAGVTTAPALRGRGRTAVFTVGNLSCAECTLPIVKALKETPGVYDAAVDLERREATVRYDVSRVQVATLRAVIEATGFPATEVAKG